jgi:thiamine pyrophosphate-dependent acetolactate synthase large subunit-like protein
MGAPQRPVALLAGDGSFQFGIQALWTASRYEVPVAFIVWNNSAYQANRRALHNYGGRAAKTGKYVGCYLGAPSIDYVALAKGYGIEAEQLDHTDRLDLAIRNCLRIVESGRSFVLDIAVEPRFAGADSNWYDFFSVARGQVRRS